MPPNERLDTAVTVPLAVLPAAFSSTLPLVVKSALARTEQLGSRVGLLYATNTAGAIAGTRADARDPARRGACGPGGGQAKAGGALGA